MNFSETGILQQEKVRIKNLLPDIGIEQARQEIIDGLSSKDPSISSKFFYDEKGSLLFEEITQLKEYYPTRTEKGILKAIAPEFMNRNRSFEIIELGSGDCSKISILLKAAERNMPHIKYIPVDFSQSAISDSANILSERYPELEIDGYVADFIHQLNLIPHSEKDRIVCFLGSTIGNFNKTEAKEIIKNLSKGILKNDTLLLGFDLVKPEEVLHAAYNDSLGVTEQFNKNILNVVNGIIQSDFNLDAFEHRAFFNPEQSRIEMHLCAIKDVEINSPFFEQTIHLKEGDSIHTENSHKFTRESIYELIDEAGLEIKRFHTDSDNWFALVEFKKKV